MPDPFFEEIVKSGARTTTIQGEADMRLRQWVLGLGLLTAIANASLAAPAYTFTSASAVSGPGDFAQATTVLTNSAITIDQIGVYAYSQGTLTESHGFRIRDLTNSVDLYNGIIAAGTGTLLNGFRYVDIPDIGVAAGIQLAIMSDNRDGSNADLMLYSLNGLSFDSSLTLVGSSFTNGVTVSGFPFGNFGTDVIAGANILINPAPEPGTLALLGLGLAGLAASRRRKQ